MSIPQLMKKGRTTIMRKLSAGLLSVVLVGFAFSHIALSQATEAIDPPQPARLYTGIPEMLQQAGGMPVGCSGSKFPDLFEYSQNPATCCQIKPGKSLNKYHR